MVWYSGDGGVLEEGAVVLEPAQLGVDLAHRANQNHLLQLGYRTLIIAKRACSKLVTNQFCI